MALARPQDIERPTSDGTKEAIRHGIGKKQIHHNNYIDSKRFLINSNRLVRTRSGLLQPKCMPKELKLDVLKNRYPHLDLSAEFRDATAWCMLHEHPLTNAFFLNWIRKCDDKFWGTKTFQPIKKKYRPPEPEAFREWHKRQSGPRFRPPLIYRTTLQSQ